MQRTGDIIHVVANAIEDHSDWLALLTEEGTLLRNPLASPSLFGAPQSAAFGAVLVIAFGLADVRPYALPVAAIAAAFASEFALLTIDGRNAGLLFLILAGLAC